MTLGERLRLAIERWPGGGIKAFAKVVKDAARGSSYPYIHDYLKDRRTPSREFIEAAARILGVRTEWLATGNGAIERRRGGVIALGTQADSRAMHRAELLITDGFPDLANLSWSVVERVTLTWMHHSEDYQIAQGGSYVWPPPTEVGEHVAASIAAALRCPIESMGCDFSALPPEQRDHYVLNACQALRGLIVATDPIGPALDFWERGEGKRLHLDR